ncbi:hypothetical protein F511_04973 [Dorcoceras hygrometricum]|uniref:Uncharacterized protein n=1 Tax=Dorcoceras hygrometricum TaxID=472368 RepID=A0A2Z7D523_9LAMI|nr:hypothetical protein F511_04973 [Dorcoceras hygrometricum]
MNFWCKDICKVTGILSAGISVPHISGRGRGRRSFTEADSESDGVNPVLNTMAQLLERLVNQKNNGNGQTSGRIVSREDPQERFRRQRPQEFSGTTDPLIAESWIKSIEVIFDYLQLTEKERHRCAIYMLRGDVSFPNTVPFYCVRFHFSDASLIVELDAQIRTCLSSVRFKL